jgi:hypothetical protein
MSNNINIETINNTSSSINFNIGDINEPGFVKNFTKQGFGLSNCLAEIIGNSQDAKATIIKFIIQTRLIIIMDNGNGMDLESIKSMFSMYKENHRNDKSVGVSGIGGKIAIYILSCIKGEPNDVHIYTKKADGDIYKISYPCKKIKQQERWTGLINISTVDPNETTKKLLYENKGTAIILPLNEDLMDLLDDQFNIDSMQEIKNNARLSHIFGKSNIEILYKKENDEKKLQLYNYFDINPNIKYHHLSSICINLYKHPNTNQISFIANYKNKLIKHRKGHGIDKLDIKDIEKLKHINDLKLIIGVRYDPLIYDEDKPSFDPSSSPSNDNNNDNDDYSDNEKNKTNKKKKKSAEQVLVEYDKLFYKNSGNSHHNSCKSILVRNNIYITDIDDSKFRKYRSGSANWKSSIMHRMLKWELSYETYSNQSNEIDSLLGIQLNKQQHSQELPFELLKLIEHLYEEEYKLLIEKWSKLYNDYKNRSLESTSLTDKNDDTKSNNSLESTSLTHKNDDTKYNNSLESTSLTDKNDDTKSNNSLESTSLTDKNDDTKSNNSLESTSLTDKNDDTKSNDPLESASLTDKNDDTKSNNSLQSTSMTDNNDDTKYNDSSLESAIIDDIVSLSASLESLNNNENLDNNTLVVHDDNGNKLQMKTIQKHNASTPISINKFLKLSIEYIKQFSSIEPSINNYLERNIDDNVVIAELAPMVSDLEKIIGKIKSIIE